MDPIELETLSKIEVLSDMEPLVKELMEAHEAKRILWFPSEILDPPPGEDPDKHLAQLR
jgi:acyl-[acyl-carrier-protein] desaturase